MNLCLLHLDTREIAEYADLSLRSKYKYADRWGFDVSAARGRICRDRPASWSKILLCQQAIERYDWLWWLDADATITNQEIDIRQFCDDAADLIATKDENGLNAGSFLIRNSAGSRQILASAWSRTEFVNHQWWEQAALQAVIADGIGSVKYIDQRSINSYVDNWQSGDLVVHFAGKTNRMEWFRKYPPFPSEVSIDECHGKFLYGAIVSQKPLRILELGIGSGYATSVLIDAIRFNGLGELTCVDNFADWGGVMPLHVKEARGQVRLIVQDEGEFLRSCPSGSYDLIVSDADHHHAGDWANEYLRVASNGAFMFFHDTGNADFPKLRKIIDAVKSLPHYHFTKSSRAGERCGRGWLWAVNRKEADAKKRICYIQLGTNGDLISLLPVLRAQHLRGNEVSVMTRAEYAPILNYVSYAKAIPVEIPNNQPIVAESHAKEMGFDEVIVTQVFCNPRRDAVVPKNWQVTEWLRTGMLDRFHELPTLFDRRDRAAEDRAMKEHCPSSSDGRPLLAVNLTGKSQPYPCVQGQWGWIRSTFGESHRIIDLGALKLDNVVLLLPFIEAAQVLITTDTVTVHLAHATGTPIIVFLPDNEFARSEPRGNWLYHCTHQQSTGDFYRNEIIGAMNNGRYCTRPVSEMTDRMCFHAVNYFWTDRDDKASVMSAYRTWDKFHVQTRRFRGVFYEREAGPQAKLVDVIDHAAAQAQGQDILIWSGRKTPIPFNSLDGINDLADSELREIADGVMAFTLSWWNEHRAQFEAVMAEEGMATCV